LLLRILTLNLEETDISQSDQMTETRTGYMLEEMEMVVGPMLAAIVKILAVHTLEMAIK